MNSKSNVVINFDSACSLLVGKENGELLIEWLADRLMEGGKQELLNNYKDLIASGIAIKINNKNKRLFYAQKIKSLSIDGDQGRAYFSAMLYLLGEHPKLLKESVQEVFDDLSTSGNESRLFELRWLFERLRGRKPTSFYRGYDTKSKRKKSCLNGGSAENAVLVLNRLTRSKFLSHRYLIAGLLEQLTRKYKRIEVLITHEEYWLSSPPKKVLNECEAAVQEVKSLIDPSQVSKVCFTIIDSFEYINSNEKIVSLLNHKIDLEKSILYYLSGSHFSALVSELLHGMIPRIDVQCQNNIPVSYKADMTIVREGVSHPKSCYFPLTSKVPVEFSSEGRLEETWEKPIKFVSAGKSENVLKHFLSDATFLKNWLHFVEGTDVKWSIVGVPQDKFLREIPEAQKLLDQGKLSVVNFVDDFSGFLRGHDAYLIPPGGSGGGYTCRLAMENDLILFSNEAVGDGVKFCLPEHVVKNSDLLFETIGTYVDDYARAIDSIVQQRVRWNNIESSNMELVSKEIEKIEMLARNNFMSAGLDE